MDKPAQRYHHGNLRAALLTETMALLEEAGVAGLSLRRLAQRLGVSRAAPYHHFASKEALLAAVIEEGFSRLHSQTQAQSDGITDPWQKLQVCGRIYLAFAMENPALYRLMMGNTVPHRADYDAIKVRSMGYYDELRQMIRGCIASGQTRHTDVELAAFTVWCGVHGLASLMLDDIVARSPADVDERAPHALIDAVLDGLVWGLRQAP